MVQRRLIDDFAISNGDDGDGDLSSALYKEELNDQKIDKLGNRITLLSILLPCLIGAIMVYGYFDIKKRVMAVHDSGQSQIDVVADELQGKFNSFEVELAKLKFALEKDIPELKQQTIAIQDELTLLAEKKIDKEETEKSLNQIREEIAKVADQYQGALHILDRTNQETLAIVNENKKALESDFDQKLNSIQETTQNLDSRIDSAVDKKIKSAAGDRVKSQQEIEKKVSDIEFSVESKLAVLEETTQILSENRKTLASLGEKVGKIDKDVDLMGKEFKNTQAKDSAKAVKEPDRQYVDGQIAALKKSLNSKIDQLDLNLSRKILQYATQMESLTRQGGSGSKKKTDSVEQNTKNDLILTKPEPGKISETDLTQ